MKNFNSTQVTLNCNNTEKEQTDAGKNMQRAAQQQKTSGNTKLTDAEKCSTRETNSSNNNQQNNANKRECAITHSINNQQKIPKKNETFKNKIK
jgi:hypothetical protein